MRSERRAGTLARRPCDARRSSARKPQLGRSEEIDAIWAEEAERRMQEIREGKVETIDGEQVMRELRARRKR